MSSYLVLARKYRPQRFSQLVGQEHVARTLTNAIAQGRVHHAFLFTGARGVGKTSAARILAKSLCCASGLTAEPCGTCELCVEISSGRSVDVFEIDGASNTGVDDVRALREGARYLPAKTRKKVYIIDEVHMLSTSAFNALLKILEEPPPHVVFVFATTEVHKIPTTILSRCQRYDFKLIPTAALTEHLAGILGSESLAFEADAVRLVARQAAGSVRDALSLLDQVIAYVGDGAITVAAASDVLGVADRRLIVELSSAILDRNPAAALRVLDSAAERGVDLGQAARALLGFLRDLEVVAQIQEPADLVEATPDELAELQSLAGRAAADLPRTLFDRWARALEDAARSQAPRLIYEMALVDLCRTEPLLPLGDLLDRLEDLEGRLASGGPAPATRQVAREPAVASRSEMAARPKPEAASRPAPVPSHPVPAATRPAATPAAQSTPPVSAEQATERWRQVLAELQERRPRLAALLAHAEVGNMGPDRVELRFSDRFGVDQTEKSRAELESVLAASFGQAVRLSVVVGSAEEAPLLKSEVKVAEDEAEADRRKRESEARAHPMIKKAQELFGVTAKEVKT